MRELEGGLNDAPEKELAHNGVYLYTDNAPLQLIIDDLTFPNGIGLSPDERTLYVAVSDPDNAKIMAYAVSADGTVDVLACLNGTIDELPYAHLRIEARRIANE